MCVGNGNGNTHRLEDRDVLAPVGYVGDALGGDGVTLTKLVKRHQLVGNAEPFAGKTETLHPRSRAQGAVARERNHGDASLAESLDRLAVTHAESLGPARYGAPPRRRGVGEGPIDVDEEKSDLRETCLHVRPSIVTTHARWEAVGVLRVPVHQLDEGEMTLDPEASRYVARVHRLRTGDDLLLFQPREAREANATVVAIGRAGVRCRVHTVRAVALRARRPITLLQGIGKGDKLDAITRDATELGATTLVAVETSRGVVRLGARGEERMRRLRRIAAQAARQCGRGDAPEVKGPLPWSEALRLAVDPPGLKLCLWEGATDSIGPKLRALGAEEPLVVAIGAEGGLEEAEIVQARALGFAIVSLGPFILRTETVTAAVLGAVLFSTA